MFHPKKWIEGIKTSRRRVFSDPWDSPIVAFLGKFSFSLWDQLVLQIVFGQISVGHDPEKKQNTHTKSRQRLGWQCFMPPVLCCVLFHAHEILLCVCVGNIQKSIPLMSH